VRAALVHLQSLKGKDAAIIVLGKFSATKTIGGVTADKYAALIAACKAAA
jgi:hypothetical protein